MIVAGGGVVLALYRVVPRLIKLRLDRFMMFICTERIIIVE
jgi:hypothetical protein